jgi:hypothetical protein
MKRLTKINKELNSHKLSKKHNVFGGKYYKLKKFLVFEENQVFE